LQGEGASTSGSGISVGIATVRGVSSSGMLCSAHDLGWAAAPNGLAVQLPPGMPPGEPLGAAPPKVGAFWGTCELPRLGLSCMLLSHPARMRACTSELLL
jgi:hypothetical protein